MKTMRMTNMKYLKRYEAIKTIQYKDMTDWGSTEPQKINKPIDPKYFNLVFADFIDDGADVYFYGKDEDGMENSEWEITILEPEVDGSDIDKYIESIDILKEKYLDIKSCINKIKDEYPNINISFIVRESGESNTWVNTIKRNIHIIFSYK